MPRGQPTRSTPTFWTDNGMIFSLGGYYDPDWVRFGPRRKRVVSKPRSHDWKRGWGEGQVSQQRTELGLQASFAVGEEALDGEDAVAPRANAVVAGGRGLDIHAGAKPLAQRFQSRSQYRRLPSIRRIRQGR